MKQVAAKISTYSSDEFGICSALFELGGMVVMHDASGCNSTYTTHDEPRWYDMDSMIYISAISEMEAIMGDDDKLIRDLIETAGELDPAFIAVVGAPIPYMIGTDLEAIAAETESAAGIPCTGFAANGMNNYTKGVSMAMDWLVKRFCGPDEIRTEKPSVNILGATPLDFSMNGSIDSIRSWLEESGFTVNACFCMGSSLEEITHAGRAHVNLVLSYGGLAAAKRLEKCCGIPYVVGVPYGIRFSEILKGMLYDAAETRRSRIAYRELSENLSCPEIGIIGECITSASLAAALELDLGIAAKVLCPLDLSDELLREQDAAAPWEDDILRESEALKSVVADPLYQALFPDNTTKLITLPHEAFSGRIYSNTNPNLICRRLRIEENRLIAE